MGTVEEYTLQGIYEQLDVLAASLRESREEQRAASASIEQRLDRLEKNQQTIIDLLKQVFDVLKSHDERITRLEEMAS